MTSNDETDPLRPSLTLEERLGFLHRDHQLRSPQGGICTRPTLDIPLSLEKALPESTVSGNCRERDVQNRIPMNTGPCLYIFPKGARTGLKREETVAVSSFTPHEISWLLLTYLHNNNLECTTVL